VLTVDGLLSQLKTQITAIWTGMSPAKRVLTGALLLGGLLSLILLAVQMGGGDYVPLFTQLRADDAGEVIAALKEMSVPYRLSNGGSTVLVPSTSVYETRLSLANEGLPRGGVVGFETFSRSQLGMTEFERRVKYQWALQGELTRTIRGLRAVEDARVHLAIPEKSVFLEEERDASASVLLQLKRGQTLTPQEVKGITYLVARSVGGLDPENVTVLDTDGNVLAGGFTETVSIGVNSNSVRDRLEIERQFERQAELSLQSMLDRVFGLGQAVVRVNAKLNFDYWEERRELWDRGKDRGGILRSEEQITEKHTGTLGDGGRVGMDGNVPGYVAEAAGTGDYTRSETIRNYEVNKTESFLVASAGDVERMSVSVWIDSKAEADIGQIEKSVSSAIGLDPSRGDSIFVDKLEFKVPVVAASTLAAGTGAGQLTVNWLVLTAALCLTVLLIWIIYQRRSVRETGAGVDVVISDEQMEREESQQELEEQETHQLYARIEELARDDPEQLASLLRSWLAEE